MIDRNNEDHCGVCYDEPVKNINPTQDDDEYLKAYFF